MSTLTNSKLSKKVQLERKAYRERLKSGMVPKFLVQQQEYNHDHQREIDTQTWSERVNNHFEMKVR